MHDGRDLFTKGVSCEWRHSQRRFHSLRYFYSLRRIHRPRGCPHSRDFIANVSVLTHVISKCPIAHMSVSTHVISRCVFLLRTLHHIRRDIGNLLSI
jgi:hypothetical protein